MRIAVIGDIHGAFDDHDVDYFNTSEYDLLLFVGDLEPIGRSPLAEGARVASRLSRLTTPALLVLGNHDGVSTPQLVAEAFGMQRAAAAIGLGHVRRLEELTHRLAPVRVCGYSAHRVAPAGSTDPGDALDVVACRPLSMGGPPLSFPATIARLHGVRTIEESAARLCQQVDRCETGRILFLAHNGPTGLGARRNDIWGRDFGRREGDHGDRDLELAVAHAREHGAEVVAVVAGHMHHAVKGGGLRSWHIVRDNVHHLNAAKVPRIVTRQGRTARHHLSLTTSADGVDVTEVLVEG